MADKTLQAALIEALAEMPNPVKNADNPAFKRDGKPMRYADLEATLEACKPVLAAVGIAVLQFPVSSERGLGVRTILMGHGEEIDCGEFFLPLEGQTPQKAAGAITYARRYALTAIFGLAQEDDDANTASGTKPETAAAKAGTADNRVRAVWGKAKALGWDADDLCAWLTERSEGRVKHPDQLAGQALTNALDALQKLIDAQDATEDTPQIDGDEIPF